MEFWVEHDLRLYKLFKTFYTIKVVVPTYLKEKRIKKPVENSTLRKELAAFLNSVQL